MIGNSIGQPQGDPKAWAVRILRNIANGKRYDSTLSLLGALEALHIDFEDWEAQGLDALPAKYRGSIPTAAAQAASDAIDKAKGAT
jgi:hypothetical protein